MDKKFPFTGRIIMLGYGTIGRCALPMVFDLFALDPTHLTVIDAEDPDDYAADYIRRGVSYLKRKIRRDNMDEVLSAAARPGDLLLNLSVGIDSIRLADWCHHNGILYVDTALEPWEDVMYDWTAPPPARTEYALHQRARRQAATSWRPDGPTAVFTHGANPGLVSHFAKAALLDIAAALNLDVPTPQSREDWAALARATGTKVIHISERDTQVSHLPRQPGEFVNTWSIPGFIEEAMMPGEIGWGTHEKSLPPDGFHHQEGPANAIYLSRPAAGILIRSWVPLGGQIFGLALPHSESITLSDYLTLREGNRVVYRPTVVFAYLPCDLALASLHETMMNNWQMPTRERILNEDIVEGRDELGVLLLGHALNGWWYGSQLDIHEARRLVPGNNPTAIQVAAGAVAAAIWAAQNPARGFCEPEDLPHDEILAIARRYLGPVVSLPTDWHPLRRRARLFEEPWLDLEDPWQFSNFLIR